MCRSLGVKVKMRGYKKLKLACYTSNITMSAVGNLSSLLFLTFKEQYGISYSLLGTLVLVNFFTQLVIDLIFSFFSHKFNIKLTVRIIPLISVAGLLLFAAAPIVFAGNVYMGLVVGTVVSSVSAGLAEVLISPIIAAIPAENPDREMSKLHSIYAWGVVGVVIITTLFLLLAGHERWQILPLIFAAIPLVSAVLFMMSDIPELETQEKTSGAIRFLRNPGVWLCVAAIFLGGASECTMAQWASGYLEAALGLPKLWGDIFGVALFAVALGLGRSLYSKFGRNAARVLFFSAIGASICYLVAALSPFAIVGLIACALTGFCVAMLWPGSLIIASEKFPAGGVLIYALMAAGGDLGASVGPQLVGVVADRAISSEYFISLSSRLGMSADSLGMRFGMLIGVVFPIAAIFVFLKLSRSRKEQKMSLSE